MRLWMRIWSNQHDVTLTMTRQGSLARRPLLFVRRLQMRHYEEQAQEGSTASAEELSSADASSGSSGCTQQASGSRQRRQQRLCSRRLAALIAAAMLISRSEALFLGGNVQTYESQEHSILARAKDLVTEAVQDAANAVGPASKRWTRQEKHTLQVKETQVGSVLPCLFCIYDFCHAT